MRQILVIVFLSLAGCSATTSLEDLEEEAMVSGDWSEVERRERMLRTQKRTTEFDCQEGLTLVCIDKGYGEDCRCLRRTTIR